MHASAEPAWAPAGSAQIQPGNQTRHCSGTGGATETNGCDSGSHPIGTHLEIEGASRPGTLVYNSWLTMQRRGETDADTCDFNDFALVRVDPADAATVNPSIPFWGGPTGTVDSTAGAFCRAGHLGRALPPPGRAAGRSGQAKALPALEPLRSPLRLTKKSRKRPIAISSPSDSSASSTRSPFLNTPFRLRSSRMRAPASSR